MKKIYNHNLLKNYIDLFNIKDLFSQDLTDYMDLYTFNKGELVLESQEPVSYFFLLVAGSCKVILNLEIGETLLIDYISPLQMIGEMEVMEDSNSKYDIIAIEDLVVIGIEMKKFKSLVFNDSKFWRSLYSNSLGKLQESVTKSVILSAYNLEYLLANYLITNSIENNDEIFVEVPNFTELAQLLGTSSRHLNRIIKKLSEANLLQKEKSRILITDYSKLSKYYIELF